LKFGAANLWVQGRRVARVPFGDFGVGVSPYPYMLMFPQDEHERLLIDRLEGLGVTVERPTELVGFDDRGDCVAGRLKRADGTEETCEASYVAGCDGARSVVRDGLNVGFPGGTYAHMFYVADAVGTGPVMNKELHVALDDAEFLAAFPMQGDGHARLIGTVKNSAVDAQRALQWSDVSGVILQRLDVEVARVNWFSTYHVHHRVASRFRAGRAFLLGDAAHIHSPVGAQGLNTGLGDAVNLAWKLAAVIQKRGPARLLDTYEPERIAFARRLIATTDRAFQAVTGAGPIARGLRTRVVPIVLPRLFALTPVRRFMFRTISQTAIDYRQSPLSSGRAGGIKAGDRLPWLAADERAPAHDNFAPLRALDWQLHVYGKPGPALAALCEARGLALQAFPWRDSMRGAGFAQDAGYLIRPDGYVGCAIAGADAARLDRYLDGWVMQTRGVRSADADALRDPSRATS
jgi:2-polyprenyl-6-methoxyphenol hydroxylase-like FAD-dependent oxidoreductase